MYYRNAQSALVVYDLTKPTSLIKAKHWVAELQRQASPGIVIALVGNKLDLAGESAESESAESEEESNVASTTTTDENDGEGAEEEDENGAAGAGAGANESENDSARKISTTEGRSYAKEEGLLFFETSAKTGFNVQEVFTAIANAIPETQLKGARGPGAIGGGVGGRNAAGDGARGGGGGGGDGGRVDLTGKAQQAKEGCAC